MKSKYPISTLGSHINQVLRKNREEGDYAVFSVTNSTGFTKSDEYFKKKVFSKKLNNYNIVYPNEFAYNPSRINVGSIDFLINESPVLVSPLYNVFKTDSDLDNNYLKYFIRSRLGLVQIENLTSGSVRDSVNYSAFKRMKIPLPPIEDQIFIASFLTRIEDLVIKRKESIRLLDEFVKSMFIEMFGDPIFNPKKLKKLKLQELCKVITKGTTPKSKDIHEEFKDGYVPFLKVYHISNGGAIDFDYKPSFIKSEIHLGLLSRSKVYPRDVLMNIVGPPLGKIGIVPNKYPEWNVNQALAIFRCQDLLNPIYLLYALRSDNFIKSIINLADGIRQQNISLEQCRNIEIPLPPFNVQNRFESIVAQVDLIKIKFQDSLSELEELFKVVSHEAFRGELVGK